MVTPKKRVYQSPTAKEMLVTTIHKDCKTPVLAVKFSTLTKPFYYPNSPKIPRYSVACTIGESPEEREFLQFIQSVEQNEGTETIVKNEAIKDGDQYVNTGKSVIKFQGKDKIPTYVVEENEKYPAHITLEDEFAEGEKIQIIYDILRYTKKNNAQNPQYGISFRPSKIYYYPPQAAAGV